MKGLPRVPRTFRAAVGIRTPRILPRAPRSGRALWRRVGGLGDVPKPLPGMGRYDPNNPNRHGGAG